MKVDKKDIKKGFVRVKPENKEDLLDLSKVIEINDRVYGQTFRKIKVGSEEKGQVIKKSIKLEISVEKKEFDRDSLSLKVLGKITKGPEDIPLGSYHSIKIENNSDVTIFKERWKNFQIERLVESTKRVSYKILIVIFDRAEATFALLTPSGYKILSANKGDVKRKDYNVEGVNFYKEIAKMIEQADKEINPDFIICASPGFYNEELRKEIEPCSFAKKIRFAVATNPGERGISEVLKRSELKEILKEERLRKESLLMDLLLKNIAKDEKFSYGVNDVFEKAQIGAIEELIVSENLIFSEKPEENKTVMDIIEMVEQNNGKVSVIEQEEPLKVIDSLGKIGAILRY